MADEVEHRARRMWRALEPLHAVTYFDPGPQEAFAALGTKGYWMGYFGQRAAPLGEVAPQVVTAVFYSFHPRLVERAVPDVWAVAPPQQFLDVRLAAADAALRRLLGAELIDSPEIVEAAEIATAAAAATSTAGRALGAANAALPVPTEPHLALWHAQTVLRELRGDGHVAALVAAGLDPVEALALFALDGRVDAEFLRARRGWQPEEWSAAVSRLVERGLLDPDGAGLTAAGSGLRRDVEARTDALADESWAAVGDAQARRLAELAAPMVRAVLGGGAFLAENPMGLVPLVATR